MHVPATNVAIAATQAFLQQILDELQGNDKGLGALLGVTSIAFVIDTTGSMDTELVEFKARVAHLVQLLRADWTLEDLPAEWILVNANDPQIGPEFVTESTDEF